MAEGLLRLRYGGTYEAFSAGTEPTGIHPLAVAVMREIDVDLSAQKAESLQLYFDQTFDAVVTTCDQAMEVCPVFPGARRMVHKGFADPSSITASDDEMLAAFRRARDEIDAWIQDAFEPRAFRTRHQE